MSSRTMIRSSNYPVVRRYPRRRRAAFSLIEILIVIGVILLLISIGVYGYRSIQETAAKKQCYSMLASAESIVKELTNAGALNRLEGSADQLPAPIFVAGTPLASPGDVNIGKAARTTLLAAGGKMEKSMKVLVSVPAASKIIQSMPQESLVPPPPSATPPVPYNPPYLADPWQNPLIFVPSSGLTGVNTEGGNNLTIKSPSGRPFWASAGPDGDFSAGNDNIYSFDK